MKNHSKAIELLHSFKESINTLGVNDLIKDSLSLNEGSIDRAIEKLTLEKLTGVELSISGNQFYRAAYHPTDVYIQYYNGDRKITNVKEAPKDEWLLHFWFSTGAYSLHEEYPTETFNRFIEELKLLEPKYLDSLNHHFYFDISKAKEVVETLPVLFNKYKVEVQKELDTKRIAKLELELGKLKKQQ